MLSNGTVFFVNDSGSFQALADLQINVILNNVLSLVKCFRNLINFQGRKSKHEN